MVTKKFNKLKIYSFKLQQSEFYFDLIKTTHFVRVAVRLEIFYDIKKVIS